MRAFPIFLPVIAAALFGSCACSTWGSAAREAGNTGLTDRGGLALAGPPAEPRPIVEAPIGNQNATEPGSARDFEEWANGRPSEPVLTFRLNNIDETEEQAHNREVAVFGYLTRLTPNSKDLEEHHLFPQALREQFAALGIDVNEFTTLIDKEKHAYAHRDQDLYGSGGRWNHDWVIWFIGLDDEDANALNAWRQVFKMIKGYGLEPLGPLSPYRCGREIMHDMYDHAKIPPVTTQPAKPGDKT